MTFGSRVGCVAAWLAFAGMAVMACAAAAETKSYSVVASGEKVGSLRATLDATVTDIDYILDASKRAEV